MSKTTKIQWCDSTVNPTMGCDGCELWSNDRKTCYAGLLHTHYGASNSGYAPTFEDVTLFPGRMADATRWTDLTGRKRPEKPWLDGLPRLIFVSDMSDALSKIVTFDYLVSEIIANVTSDEGRRHQWLWLTKRPDRMAKFSEWLAARCHQWPLNLWAGTSVTTQATTSRIRQLLEVGHNRTIRFVSVEPQVEPIDLGESLPKLSWVIQGGESGAQARPFDLEWAVALLTECRRHGVPYFLKQLGSRVVRSGEKLRFGNGHAGDWSEWPCELRVRQFPIPAHMVA
jgi:protein gp37